MGKIIGLCLLMIISSVSYSAENSTPQKDDNSQLDLISEEVQTSYIDDNLNNTSARITLPDNVMIYSNWFTTSITACYYYNGHQVITYADNLNGNKTLSQHTNIK